MNEEAIKQRPNLFLFGDMCDFSIVLSDLKLIHKKTEELDFDNSDDQTNLEETLITYSFPAFPRSGFIVTLMIMAENQFRSFVTTLRILEDYPIKWNHLRGSAFDKLLIFSEKLSKIRIDVDKIVKDRIRSLIETRNCIVHSNSCVPEYSHPEVVEKFVNSLTGCTVEDGYIHLSFEGCFECADLVENFMTAVYHAALKKYPKEKDILQ